MRCPLARWLAYDGGMAFKRPARVDGLTGWLTAWLTGWWQTVHLGAVLLVLALSPAAQAAIWRRPLAWRLVAASGPMLAGFSVVSAVISLVVTRIVTVTALGYGLSQYALEMVVRVLVLELIPLAAALFAALRATLPMAAELASELAALRASGGLDALRQQGRDPLVEAVLPRVLAGMFAVLLLATVSCALTLLLAYLSVHGFTLGGFDGYTRTVGRIFNPALSLIFGLKVLLLSGAVSLIPVASVLQAAPRPRSRASVELQSLVRMFLVILLIEAASLVGNYY